MIKYFENHALQVKVIAQLYINSGVDRPITDLTRLQTMFDHSNLIISAWEGDRLIGIARALTDYSYCCYLSDLAVDQKYQRLGVGSNLIALVRKAIGVEVSLYLFSSPEAIPFYEKVGFKKAINGFVTEGIL